MKMKKSSLLAISLIVSKLSQTESSPFTIADDRVRNMDISPVLGRGYSIMTNTYQSTCLDVDGTTVPSYNYECEYSSLIQ